jgi:hypothetical protein
MGEYPHVAHRPGPIRSQPELWDTAVRLHDTVAPADYKHYVLPLIAVLHWTLTIVSWPAPAKGFVVFPRRWVVERSLVWFGFNRSSNEWRKADLGLGDDELALYDLTQRYVE